MSGQSLLLTLGGGSLLAFLIFFIFYKVLHFKGVTTALLTALIMLLLYLPLAILNWPGVDTFAIHFAFFMMIAYGLGIVTSRSEHNKGEKKRGLHWAPITIIVFFVVLAMVDSTIITLATKGVDGKVADWLLPEAKQAEIRLDPESIARQEQRDKAQLGDAFNEKYNLESGTGTQSKFPGTVAYDVRNREAKYNSNLDQYKQQEKRGWQMQGGWVQPPKAGKTETFEVTMKDKQGNPLSDLKVAIDFMRPSSQQRDQRHVLTYQGDGVYQVVTALPDAGLWHIEVRATRGEDLHKVRGKTTVIPALNSSEDHVD